MKHSFRSLLPIPLSVIVYLVLGSLAAEAQCPSLPYTLTNGQTTDATQVMADLNALLNCLNNGQFASLQLGKH